MAEGIRAGDLVYADNFRKNLYAIEASRFSIDLYVTTLRESLKEVQKSIAQAEQWLAELND